MVWNEPVKQRRSSALPAEIEEKMAGLTVDLCRKIVHETPEDAHFLVCSLLPISDVCKKLSAAGELKISETFFEYEISYGNKTILMFSRWMFRFIFRNRWWVTELNLQSG